MVIVIYWRSSFLPPTMKLGQGYIFTGICDSVNRGVCLVWGSLVWGCLIPRGCLVLGGVWSWGFWSWGYAWSQGVSGPGGLVPGGSGPGGISGPGGCAWSWGVPGPGGICCQGDLLLGCVPGPGGLLLGGLLVPGWDPPGTGTAAGGTHPTGMHSCIHLFLKTSLNRLILINIQLAFKSFHHIREKIAFNYMGYLQ